MRNYKGLTLLEMLVSLVILSFLSAIGYQGIGFIVDKSRKNTQRMTEGYQLHQGLQWMRNSMQILDNKVQQTGQSYVVDVTGDRSNIRFRCNIASRTTQDKGYCHVRFDMSNRKIMLDYIEKDRAGTDSYQSQVMLIDNVSDLSFEYYGRDSNGAGAWVSSWQLSNNLPRAVKISVTGPGDRVDTVLAYANTWNRQ